MGKSFVPVQTQILLEGNNDSSENEPLNLAKWQGSALEIPIDTAFSVLYVSSRRGPSARTGKAAFKVLLGPPCSGNMSG